MITCIGLLEENALLLEPRDVYDKAIVGIVEQCGSRPVACYSVNLLIPCIQEVLGNCDYTTAIEWFEYNILGCYLGEYTPMYLFNEGDDAV